MKGYLRIKYKKTKASKTMLSKISKRGKEVACENLHVLCLFRKKKKRAHKQKTIKNPGVHITYSPFSLKKEAGCECF